MVSKVLQIICQQQKISLPKSVNFNSELPPHVHEIPDMNNFQSNDSTMVLSNDSVSPKEKLNSETKRF